MPVKKTSPSAKPTIHASTSTFFPSNLFKSLLSFGMCTQVAPTIVPVVAQVCHILECPNDILIHIASFLIIDEFLKFANCCKQLRRTLICGTIPGSLRPILQIAAFEYRYMNSYPGNKVREELGNLLDLRRNNFLLDINKFCFLTTVGVFSVLGAIDVGRNRVFRHYFDSTVDLRKGGAALFILAPFLMSGVCALICIPSTTQFPYMEEKLKLFNKCLGRRTRSIRSLWRIFFSASTRNPFTLSSFAEVPAVPAALSDTPLVASSITSLVKLVPAILDRITSFLDLRDCIRLSHTCRIMRHDLNIRFTNRINLHSMMTALEGGRRRAYRTMPGFDVFWDKCHLSSNLIIFTRNRRYANEAGETGYWVFMGHFCVFVVIILLLDLFVEA